MIAPAFPDGSTETAPTTSVAARWMPGIEIVRGIAALVVVFHHLWSLSTTPRFRWYWIIEGFGSFGVNIFFVLSAFLLSPPCWKMRNRGDLTSFWGRRAARIMPAYLANVVVLFLFFAPAGVLFTTTGVKQVVANLTFTHHLFPSTASSLGTNGVLWTLSIEMILYVLLPPIGWLFARAPLVVFSAMMILGTGWRLVIGISGDGLRSFYFGDSALPPAMQSLFIARQFIGFLPLFAIGMGTRWVLERHADRLSARIGKISVPVTAALLAPGAVYLIFVERSSFYDRWVWFSTFDTMIAVLIVPALVVAASGRLSRSGLTTGAEWLGRRSYGIYLWHFPVILIAYERGIAYTPPVVSHIWLRVLFVLVVTALLAEVSFRSIEMPSQRWAKRWLGRR